MEHHQFEIIDFVSRRGGNLANNGYLASVTRSAAAKSKKYSVGLSQKVSQVVNDKCFTHFQIHRDIYTDNVYLVFFAGSEKNGRISHEKSGQVKINNAPLVEWLAKRLGKTGDFTAQVKLSHDLANTDEFATFQIFFNNN